MSRYTLALTVACTLLITFAEAAFNPSAKNNVAVYWGQGPYQARLVETCKNPNVDTVIIGFVNVFPDQGKGGWPGTDFGNACGAATYKTKNNVQTQLLSSCPDIGPDITACQTTYGKKVLLSLGGDYPTAYFIASDQGAVSFANFLWGSFGPVTQKWTNDKGPRPFGTAVVDGFDFDIESEISKTPTFKGKPVKNYKVRGYAKMIKTLKEKLYPTDKTKKYYISGSPQCVVPDEHFAKAVQTAWFDFLFIQFYNTPICSARAGVNYIEGASSIDISYAKWSQVKFFNKNAKIYIGIPGSSLASKSLDYYLPPLEADLLIRKYSTDSKFGGVMLWEATYAMNNIVCGKNYPTWIKQLLVAAESNTSINTITNDCPSPKVKCGTCPSPPVSTDGRCGANYGTTCSGSAFGPCCSVDGFCSSTYNVCSSPAGCDSRWADCTAAAQVQPSRKLFKRQGAEDLTPVDQAPLSTQAISTSADIAATTAIPTTTSELPFTFDPLTTTESPVSEPLFTFDPLTTTASPAVVELPASSTTIADVQALTTDVPATTQDSTSAPPFPTTSSAVLAANNTSTSDTTTSSTSETQVLALPTSSAGNGSFVQSNSPAVEQTETRLTTPSSTTKAAVVASITPAATLDTTPVQQYQTVTLISTVYSTITEDGALRTITTTVPITTTIALAFAAPSPTVVTTTITTCDPAVESCSDHPELQTRTVRVTSTLTATVTVQAAAEEVLTSYSTQYYTTVVNLALNPDNTLYNPHANQTNSTRTTSITRTETIRITQTVTPMTTTDKSTTTIMQFVTVAPVAKFPSGVGAGKDVVVNRVKASGTGDLLATVDAMGGQASGTAKPLAQTGAGGRLSPRDGVAEAKLVLAMGLCVMMLLS
ncbi:Endochitinase-like protein 2 [Elsinoe fawcettii]|nr:Endochitinase-like protein 2 [Elsinoe fawcettii]